MKSGCKARERQCQNSGADSWQWMLWEEGDGLKGRSLGGQSGQQGWELH